MSCACVTRDACRCTPRYFCSHIEILVLADWSALQAGRSFRIIIHTCRYVHLCVKCSTYMVVVYAVNWDRPTVCVSFLFAVHSVNCLLCSRGECKTHRSIYWNENDRKIIVTNCQMRVSFCDWINDVHQV